MRKEPSIAEKMSGTFVTNLVDVTDRARSDDVWERHDQAPRDRSAGNASPAWEGNHEGPDRARLMMLINMLFGVYEKSYFAHQYGVIGATEWSRFEKQICVQLDRLDADPDARVQVESVVTEEFIEYIDALCKEGALQ